MRRRACELRLITVSGGVSAQTCVTLRLRGAGCAASLPLAGSAWQGRLSQVSLAARGEMGAGDNSITVVGVGVRRGQGREGAHGNAEKISQLPSGSVRRALESCAFGVVRGLFCFFSCCL